MGAVLGGPRQDRGCAGGSAVSERKRRRAPAPGDARQDAHEEVAFHIASAVQDLMAEGLDEAAARREAERRFGSVDRVEGQLVQMGVRRARRQRWSGRVMDLVRDVRHGVRNLRRRPAFGLMMVGILALGVAATVAVFRVIDGAYLRPLPYRNGDRLVQILSDDPEGRYGLSWPEFQDWAREGDFLAGAATATARGVTLREGSGEPEAVMAGLATAGFLPVLGLDPLIGRGFTEDDVVRREPVVMLSEAVWRGRFGADPSVVGTSLQVDGQAHVVIGVMPEAAPIAAGFGNAGLWLPFEEQDYMVRSTHFLPMVARLRDGLSIEQAQARADALVARLAEDAATGHPVHAVAIEDLRATLIGPSRPVLLALGVAVGFVLLIVFANLTNLFLAHTMDRAREFAVRASLGAGRRRLLRQVITEGALVGLTGGVVGLLLSRLLGGLVSAATGSAANLAPNTTLDPRITLLTIGASLVLGAGIAAWPAARAAFGPFGTLLRSGTRTIGDRRAWRRRRWLVGTEVALTVILLAGAALMIRSVRGLLEVDPGFTGENVLTFTLRAPPARYPDDAAIQTFHERVLAGIRAVPGVAAAGATIHLPLDGSNTNGSFRITGREFPDGEGPRGNKRVISAGYFEALGIPVLAGRAPTVDDRGEREVVVISEELARRYWPDESPIGKQVAFSWGPPTLQEVVGVVGEVKQTGLDEQPIGTIYRLHTTFATSYLKYSVRTTGDPTRVTSAIRGVVREVDPDVPLASIRTMDEIVAASVGNRRTLMQLLTGFAVLGMLLAALGVYAVASQAVLQRRGEIGVRMALGARATDVLRMVVGEETWAVVAGLVVGMLGAFAATRLLEASLFGVSATDPLAFGAAIVTIAGAALVATAFPAARAAATDPAVALRSG